MKMIGKTPFGKNVICRCCLAPSWRKTVKRAAKRSERNAWKRNLSNI